MNRLIEQLRDSGRPPVAGELDLESLASRVIARCADRQPATALKVDPGTTIRVCADAERLSSSLEHVIRNAQDASRPEGRVELEISAANGQARIVIADTGDGMTPDFLRERLFRPFDSTKGSKGMGIGAYQVREYIQSIGGMVDVQSNPGQGTRFEIRLPLAGSRGNKA
jgi:signal transduction histidine kinase